MTRPVHVAGLGTTPRGPEGLPGADSTVPGPPGYNATGAAEDQQTIADYIAATAGPNPVADAVVTSTGAPVALATFATPGATGDQTAAVQAAIDAIYAAGGGTLLVDGYYRCNGQLLIPHDNATPYPLGRSLRITGHDGSSTLTGLQRGKSILDLRYSGAGAKIVALGQAIFEMDHFSLEDRGSSSTPFVLVTQAVPRFHHMSVIGNESKHGIECNQDAFIMGGTKASYDNTQLSGFAGYGGSITENQFAHIRRAVYMRTFCNDLIVAGNWNMNSCGSNLPGGACYEIDPTVSSGPAGFAIGNILRENVIEQTNYPYGILVKGAGNWIIDNGCYDEEIGYLADVRIEASGNHYRPKVRGSVPLSEATPGITKVLDGREGELGGGWTARAGGSSVPLAVQARVGQSVPLFEVRKPDGAVAGKFNAAGSLRMDNVGDDFPVFARNNSFAVPAVYGLNDKWGGATLGDGGSGANVGLMDSTGVVRTGVYMGIGSPAFTEGVTYGLSAPPGSIYVNRAGGVGATLWVKRSGTDGTGWFAVA